MLGDLHHEESDDHRDIADGIGEEAPTFTDTGDENSRNGWADDAGAVEHGRIESDGIHQVFLANHLYEEVLPAGNVEGIDHAQERGEQENMPDLHIPRESQSGENGSQNHGSDLSTDDDFLAVVTVGDNSAEGRNQEDGKLAGEAYRAEQERRTCQTIDKPRLGDALHPSAD